MSTINNGGPAFSTENEHQSGNSTWHYEGMTLRDYFAAKVILGMYCDGSMKDALDFADDQTSMHKAAAWAYAQADAMLRAREAA